MDIGKIIEEGNTWLNNWSGYRDTIFFLLTLIIPGGIFWNKISKQKTNKDQKHLSVNKSERSSNHIIIENSYYGPIFIQQGLSNRNYVVENSKQEVYQKPLTKAEIELTKSELLVVNLVNMIHIRNGRTDWSFEKDLLNYFVLRRDKPYSEWYFAAAVHLCQAIQDLGLKKFFATFEKIEVPQKNKSFDEIKNKISCPLQGKIATYAAYR